MKTKAYVCYFCVSLFLASFLVLNVKATSSLSLTVAVDKPIYRLQVTPPSNVSVGGNLTLNGKPLTGALVAVTVFQGTSFNHYVRPILFRTLATGGSVPNQNWGISISLSVMGWNGSRYVPKTVFTCPSSSSNLGPAFNVTVTNTVTLPALYLTLTVVDAAGEPIEAYALLQTNQSISANSVFSTISTTSLSSWVSLGNATAYVSAFNNVPPYIYYPYCPEVSKQFSIVQSGGGQVSVPKPTPSLVKGNYNLTFELNYYQALPNFSPWGNYTAIVSSSYTTMLAQNSHTFWVRIPGDVNGDGIVNGQDLYPMARWWLQTVPPAPAYVDLNGDGIINGQDLFQVARYWLMSEQRSFISL